MVLRWIGKFLTVLVLGALLATLEPAIRHARQLAALMREPLPRPLTIPVQGVALRTINDSWHHPRSGGRRHEGVDIFARCGTAVLAATAGLVVRLGENPLGGKTVGVLGPGGSWHYYAHLSRYAGRAPGDWVRAGEVIGHVGRTGNARGTPCHLHYGLYGTDRQARNPYPLFFREGETPTPAAPARKAGKGSGASGCDGARRACPRAATASASGSGRVSGAPGGS